MGKTALLQEAMSAYVPTDRRNAMAAGHSLPSHTQGTAVFADISGFTALTESLVSEYGPQRGAEEIIRFLNQVFDLLIAELDEYRGSVIGFSGDAMTCWFDADDGLRAAAAALAMQRQIQSSGSIETSSKKKIALAMKVALATGPVRRFLVGDSHIQVVDVIAGSTLEALAAAEHLAKKGEVVLAPSSAVSLGRRAKINAWRLDAESGDSFGVLGGLAIPVDPSPWPPLAPEALSLDQVRPWLLAPVYERLKGGLGEFLAELRPAAALFLRFGGIDYDRDAEAESKLDAFIRQVEQSLACYEGSLIQLTLGDKGSYLYAAFGAPAAHEDDACRAATAALELRGLAESLDFISSIQIGVCHGSVLAGSYGGATRRTYGAQGDDVNLAARLMQAAPPGQILASNAARQAAGDLFEWQRLPDLSLKGKARPAAVFQLQGLRERSIDLQHGSQTALPIIGRERELRVVEDKLGLTLLGQGQILGITGEAGIGKSRFVAEVLREAAESGFTCVEGECHSYGRNTTYLVWQTIWRSLFGLDLNLPLPELMRRLEARLAQVDPAFIARLPLLGAVLNLPIADNDLTGSLDAKLRKGSLEALLVDCMRVFARERPLLIVLEDCHWIDSLSHDLLEALGRTAATLPVLLLLAYRPLQVEQSPLRVAYMPYFSEIHLAEFTQLEAARLIAIKMEQIYGNQVEAPPSLVELVTRQAEGNPFYIEELLNYLHDKGIDPRDCPALDKIALPASLHSLVLSRIDRLTEEDKLTLKVAAVVGNTFQLEVIALAHPSAPGEQALKDQADRLERRDFTRLESPAPCLSYIFKHNVTRDVAYETLLFEQRRQLHRAVSKAVEGLSPEAVVQIAQHAYIGEDWSRALHHLTLAGRQAQKLSANPEGIEHYKKAIHCTEQLGEAEGILSQQQAIYETLGNLFTITGQFDAAEGNLRQALNLSDRLADMDAKARACRWMAYAYELRSDYPAAQEWITGGLQALGDRQTAAAAELMAIAGLICTRQGDYETAAKRCDEAIQLAGTLGEDASLAMAHNSRGLVEYSLGNNLGAIQHYQPALALYEKLENIHGQGLSHNSLSSAYQSMGQYSEADRHLRQARQIFAQVGDVQHQAFADNNLGEIARRQGRPEQALAYYSDALKSLERLGASAYVIGVLHMNLGAAYSQLKEFEAARQHFRTSLDHFDQAHSRDYLPELHRHMGEAALAAGDLETAHRLAQQAMDLAIELTMRIEEGKSLRLLGDIACQAGDFSQAEQTLQESQQVLLDDGQEYEAARTQLSLARVYAAQGLPQQALDLLDRCQPVFQRLDAPVDLAVAQELRRELA